MTTLKEIKTKIDNCDAKITFQDAGGEPNGYALIEIYRNDGIKAHDGDEKVGIESWSAYKTFDDQLFIHEHSLPEVFEQRYPNCENNAIWVYSSDDCWDHMLHRYTDDEYYENTAKMIIQLIEEEIQKYRERRSQHC